MNEYNTSVFSNYPFISLAHTHTYSQPLRSSCGYTCGTDLIFKYWPEYHREYRSTARIERIVEQSGQCLLQCFVCTKEKFHSVCIPVTLYHKKLYGIGSDQHIAL